MNISKILIKIIIVFSFSFFSYGQTDFDIKIPSKILKTERKIKVHLPESYNDSINKTYPLIVVLDSEVTFYFTVGNASVLFDPDPDYELAPETIVVGIYQNYTLDGTSYNVVRGKDSSWDAKTSGFSKTSSKFYGFLKNELIPFLEFKYRIGPFKTILGHSLTASFVSSMLVENDNVFDAYILLSPNWTDFNKTLFDNIEKRHQKSFVYLSTSEYDIHKEEIKELHSNYFSKTLYKNVKYKFDDFDKEDHMSLINRSLPYAIKHLFSYYNPINKISYDNFRSASDKMKFLNEVYEKNDGLYGTNRKIRDFDLLSLADVAIEKKDWKTLKDIADINIKLYPNLETGYYSLGKYEEAYNKDLKKALKCYKKGYANLGDEVRNKQHWYAEIERVEKLLSKK